MNTGTPLSAWFAPHFDNDTNYDEIKGHICETCNLVWLHGYDRDELGADSATFSDEAETFVTSAAGIIAEDEPDTAGYFDCLICDETKIDGHPTTILVSA